MSGLNVSLGFLLGLVLFSALSRTLLSLRPPSPFPAELSAAFLLAACRLELQTLLEVGLWAGGFGSDVSYTLLFLSLLAHGLLWRDVTGNPCTAAMAFLQGHAPGLVTLACIVCQFAAAHLARMLATWFWWLELTDMHVIKNLMAAECSPTLRVPVWPGAITEAACSLAFHLLMLGLRSRPPLIRLPITAMVLTLVSVAASSHTSGLMNPSLAYALTFHCPGFTFAQYATVYWLGPLAGMSAALFLYEGHIPQLFSRNLLYSQKSRFKVPKGRTTAEQADRGSKAKGGRDN